MASFALTMHVYFAHPWLLWSLAFLPVLRLISALSQRRRSRQLIALAGLTTGSMLARTRPGRLHRLAVGLGLSLLAIGMAGPRWGRDWSQSAAPGRDLIAVVDCSRSMYAEAPSRLERVQTALLTLTDSLARRGGHRLGLVVFAGTARLACPLTHDLAHFRECVQAIDVSVPDATLGSGTRIGVGLSLAVDAFSGRSRVARDILLLSDGDDPARDGEYRSGIARAKEEGIPVHVVAIGDANEPRRIPEGSRYLMHDGREVHTRLEEAPLREVARQTGGTLLLGGSRDIDLGEYYQSIAAHDAEDSPDALPVARQRQQWFLFPALGFLSLALLFSAWKGRS